MSLVLHLLFLLVVLANIAAAVLSLRATTGASERASRLVVRILAVAAGLQLTELVVAWVWQGNEVLGGAALALGLFSAVLAGGFAAFASRYRAEGVGVLVAPAALVAGVLSAATSHAAPLSNSDFGWARPFHVVAVATASGVMALAAALAFLHLTQAARLKRKDLSVSSRSLVPLGVLDLTVARLSYAAFFLYTAAVVAGAFMVRAHGVTVSELVWRAVAGVGTWCIYGAVVGHRLVFHARGQRAMRSVVVGFFLSLLLYVVYATAASHTVVS